jgi:hypothetical protein
METTQEFACRCRQYKVPAFLNTYKWSPIETLNTLTVNTQTYLVLFTIVAAIHKFIVPSECSKCCTRP